MIELIASTIMLALIVTAVVAVTSSISTLRSHTRDTVYLSVHNVNCMERLRQECIMSPGDMLLYYDDAYLGSDTIETQAFLERAEWDSFNIYTVRIVSQVRETKQRLTSEYIITDIGTSVPNETINSE